MHTFISLFFLLFFLFGFPSLPSAMVENRTIISKNDNEKRIVYLYREDNARQILKSENTHYVIKDHVDLMNQDITVGKRSILDFQGGSLSNGRLLFEDGVFANDFCFNNVTFTGDLNFLGALDVPIQESDRFIHTILALKPVNSTNPTVFNFSASQPYKWDGVVSIDKKCVTLQGGGTIEGTLKIGMSINNFDGIGGPSYATTSHSNIIVTNLRFSKYGVIGSSKDNVIIENFLDNASPIDSRNVGIYIINAANIKIANCFFDNVPFPIVYDANKSFVNQNVRRLNVSNCDFEKCTTAIYAPSNIDSSIEYGDLELYNSNIFAKHNALELHCIDGFKLIGNVFSTTKVDYTQLLGYQLGQVVISGNSFYGENSRSVIELYDVGNAHISGNLFSSIGNSEGCEPSKESRKACVRIQQIKKEKYTDGLIISNNAFFKVNKLPILVEGDVRGLYIDGNSIQRTTYLSDKRILYSIGQKVQVNYLQSNIPSSYTSALNDGTYTRVTRLRALRDYRNANANYARQEKELGRYRIGPDTNEISVSISSFTKTKPITILTFPDNVAKENSDINLLFNGIVYQVNVKKGDTRTKIMSNLCKRMQANLSLDFLFNIIGDCLYIVGKTASQINDIPTITWDNNKNNGFVVLFENLGYQMCLKDIDGKNPYTSTEPQNYSPIDMGDDGKVLNVNGKIYTIKTSSGDQSYGKYFFRTPKSQGLCLHYIFNDACVGYYYNGRESIRTYLSSIVSTVYPELFRSSGDTLILREEGKEYYMQDRSSVTNYMTFSGHVVKAMFIDASGAEHSTIK